jgi:hypothetical protein
VIVSDPAVVAWGPARFDLVAFGGDYHLYHWSSAQTGYDLPVASLQGVGTPTIVSAATNSLDAVFRNLNGGVSLLNWNGTTWGSEVLGGSILGMPSAAATAGPVRRVYALGHDGRLYENARVGSSAWTGWASVSSAAGTATLFAGSPRAVIRSDGIVTVHVRTTTNALAIFERLGGWGVSVTTGNLLQGTPTALRSGYSWARGMSTNDLVLAGTSTVARRGGFME